MVENSERVTLEVRDRFRPDLVLRSTQLYRYTDYNIDYVQGTLFFKQPVPSLDVDDNPVFIVAIYESLLNPREQLVLGARAEARPTTGLRLGGQVISEEREGGNYGLVEGDVRWSPSRQLTLDGELARSQVAGRDGSAWRLSATFAPNSRGQARAYFKQIDPEFENATTSSFELGMRQYGLMGGYRFGRDAYPGSGLLPFRRSPARQHRGFAFGGLAPALRPHHRRSALRAPAGRAGGHRNERPVFHPDGSPADALEPACRAVRGPRPEPFG
jgi:hypothetical protein